MKLCIDCKRYQPATGRLKHIDGYGRVEYFELPDLCLSMQLPHEVDPVAGGVSGNVFPANQCRSEEEKCGRKGKWFEPATLDGRLAMLDDDGDEHESAQSQTPTDA